MFQAETSCRFPIFTDLSGELFEELGMIRTSNLGTRPDYQRHGMAANIWKSFRQRLKLLKESKIVHSGDKHQVGGHFLFEPTEIDTPRHSIVSTDSNRLPPAAGFRIPRTPVDGEKRHVSWCYRMRHARDHVELPELREVLGMKDDGGPGNHPKRWARALKERKGTGASWMTNMERWHLGSYLSDGCYLDD